MRSAMNDYFAQFTQAPGFRRVALEPIFDAGRDTPELVHAVARDMPQIEAILESLRHSLPLVPDSRIGLHGDGPFCRIPNHYRSVSFMVPSEADPSLPAGAILFKGTEPLLGDFQEYLDWMLATPFRSAMLPLGLHFPLELKVPPGAMWIKECKAEQFLSSQVQQRHLQRFGYLARVPLPLFVYKLTVQQVARYAESVRNRIGADAFRKIESKLADGLGIEVYYYPSLPVRAADVQVSAGKDALMQILTPDDLGVVFDHWIGLLSRLLKLGYMPYAPWNHGLGSCVDPGNACIDGGFNDLLTLVPFSMIPSEAIFRQSLQLTLHSLADSVATLLAASTEASRSQASILVNTYLLEGLRKSFQSSASELHDIDGRLLNFFKTPTVEDLIQEARELNADWAHRGAQFVRDLEAFPQAATA